MNESKFTYAAVFDDFTDVKYFFSANIFERPMYGQHAQSIVVQTNTKMKRKNCPSFTRSYRGCVKMTVE